jgi:transposase
LAANKKNARRQGRSIVFLDESGFMLQPVVRRTWAPKGQTPIHRSWDRHDRLSVTTALTLAPRRRRLNVYWRGQRQNICADDIVAFLRQLRAGIRRPLVLIWDRWSVHRSKVVREYLERHRGRIRVEWLPAYAPELNPAEQVWNHAKYSDLANFIPEDCDDLHRQVDLSLEGQCRQSNLLRSFFKTARLAL